MPFKFPEVRRAYDTKYREKNRLKRRENDRLLRLKKKEANNASKSLAGDLRISERVRVD